MRFLTLMLLLVAVIACKNQPSKEDYSWRDLPADPYDTIGQYKTKGTSAFVFNDTVLVSLGAKDFAAVCKLKPNMPILDLRTEKEYKNGHVWRSVNMDVTDKDFDRRLAGFGRNQEYAVYCQFGDKSFQVAENMKKMGFMRIYHLQKGLSMWGESGQALQLK